ncbi:glycosyltransferase [Bifidobacterium dolichotidis]
MGIMTEVSQASAATNPRPLTIVLVLDAAGNRGNGTSNSALQWAAALKQQGHHVRLVGIGAPNYPAQENLIPFVSWIARKQQMHFAKPSDALFRRAFEGADVVHLYMPFSFCRHAMRVAQSMGIPVTAGYHVQPENITYSAGPLRHIPGIDSFIYRLFRHWIFDHVNAIHVPTQLGATLLRKHHYHEPIYVISNGYEPRFTPSVKPDFTALAAATAAQESDSAVPIPTPLSNELTNAMINTASLMAAQAAPEADLPWSPEHPMHIIASGRLTNEKNHTMLIEAIAQSRHADSIKLTIAGTGPLAKKLRKQAQTSLPIPAEIGFHKNSDMPALLRSGDILVHPSIADLESISVLEGMACGLVPIIADSPLSAAGQFSLDEHCSFPVDSVETLTERIDWWFEHPTQIAQWSGIYAAYTKEHYSVAESVKEFADMEYNVIASA